MEKIEDVLQIIKEQSGLCLVLCDYFTGIRGTKRKKYFNVILKDNTYMSQEYVELERLAKKGIISKVSTDGAKRVAIYF